MKDLIGLDFETYWAADYSLSLKKYNTSEYVRDPQFLIHGCGFQEVGKSAYWIEGHDASLKHCQTLGLDQRSVVAHNMAFDGFILHEHGGVHVGQYCDTLGMARATMGHHIKHNLNNVGELLGFGGKTQGLAETKGLRVLPPHIMTQLGIYCMTDVELCMKIFHALSEYMPDDEMKLIDITARMFCDPRLLVDTELVWSDYELEIANKRAATLEANTEKDILMSNDKFADLLRSLGQEPPTKVSPKTGKVAYAFAKTDPGFKELKISPNEAVRFAAEARERVKSTIGETRALRLFAAGLDGLQLPVLLNYAGAHTFRWSGGNKLNLQNLPRDGALRRAILAPVGHQIFVIDQSQIEARITAWLAKQADRLNEFAAYDKGTGADVYRLMAARIYGKSVSSVTKSERFIGKICVLALGFGMGWKRLKLTLAVGFMGPPVEISERQAKHIVYTYRRSNAAIGMLWDRLGVLLEHMATDRNFKFEYMGLTFMYRMVELPNGLALKYPGLTSNDGQITYQSRNGRAYIWGGTLLENLAQALARCVIGENMIKISERYFIAMMTHDEISAIAPDDEIEEAYKWAADIMTTPPTWAPGLPLAIDGSYDRRYSK
jgi:DNA polymerase